MLRNRPRQLTENAREFNELVVAECLSSEEENQMIEPGLANHTRLVVRQLSNVAANHLRAEGARKSAIRKRCCSAETASGLWAIIIVLTPSPSTLVPDFVLA